MAMRPLISSRNIAVITILALASLSGAELSLVDAVKAGNRDAIHAILSSPAGKTAVNTAEPDGTTPLHWAVRADDAVATRELIAAGAKANVTNRYGVTP